MAVHWWKEAKIYELYIDKFAGDVRSLTSHLDYFEALGINCLHILPHYPSPMVDGGYDVSDYRGVRTELGTLADFKELVAVAREKGLRIITDLVLNHTSTQHPWFRAALSSRDNPKRDYYVWSDTIHRFSHAVNATPSIKPGNWIPTGTQGYYFATFYPEQPDLNWDNPAVFEEMVAIMEFWAEMGVSGFRLDAVPFLIKREGTNCANLPEVHDVLKRLRERLEVKYPEVIFLAEASTHSRQYFGNGDECHMVYNFLLTEFMWRAILRGEHGELARIARESGGIPENCQWATFLRNHDSLGMFSLSGDERQAINKQLDPTGSYTHDASPSVRVAEVFQGDVKKSLDAFRMLYGMSGAPIMYYGDEVGMRNLPPDSGIIDKRYFVRGQFDWEEAQRQMHDPNSLFGQTADILHTRNPGKSA